MSPWISFECLVIYDRPSLYKQCGTYCSFGENQWPIASLYAAGYGSASYDSFSFLSLPPTHPLEWSAYIVPSICSIQVLFLFLYIYMYYYMYKYKYRSFLSFFFVLKCLAWCLVKAKEEEVCLERLSWQLLLSVSLLWPTWSQTIWLL